MVCGGFRETGSKYASIVSQIRLQKYEIYDFIVRKVEANAILINYIVNVEAFDKVLDGKFRVSSLWVKSGKWCLIRRVILGYHCFSAFVRSDMSQNI